MPILACSNPGGPAQFRRVKAGDPMKMTIPQAIATSVVRKG